MYSFNMHTKRDTHCLISRHANTLCNTSTICTWNHITTAHNDVHRMSSWISRGCHTQPQWSKRSWFMINILSSSPTGCGTEVEQKHRAKRFESPLYQVNESSCSRSALQRPGSAHPRFPARNTCRVYFGTWPLIDCISLYTSHQVGRKSNTKTSERIQWNFKIKHHTSRLWPLTGR